MNDSEDKQDCCRREEKRRDTMDFYSPVPFKPCYYEYIQPVSFSRRELAAPLTTRL